MSEDGEPTSVGAQHVKVEGDDMLPMFVDVVMDGGVSRGAIAIVLGAADSLLPDGKVEGNRLRVRCVSKLRMSTAFAAQLHATLGQMLAEAEQQDRGPANDPGTHLN